MRLPVTDIPGVVCGKKDDDGGPDVEACAVRDVWAQKDLPPVSRSDGLDVDLRAHQSAFLVIGGPVATRGH